MLIALFAAQGDSMRSGVWQIHERMHEGIVCRAVTVDELRRRGCRRALKLGVSGSSSYRTQCPDSMYRDQNTYRIARAPELLARSCAIALSGSEFLGLFYANLNQFSDDA
jgi:hypothetical protein